MVPLLPENEDSGAVNEIAPPQALRFAEQSKQPFEARALHPQGRAALRPGKELQRCPDTQGHAARAAALAYFRADHFTLRCADCEADDIGSRGLYGLGNRRARHRTVPDATRRRDKGAFEPRETGGSAAKDPNVAKDGGG